LGIWEYRLPSLNTIVEPIGYKYREGKVKKLPEEGGEIVIETLQISYHVKMIEMNNLQSV